MAKEKLITDGEAKANISATLKRLLAEKHWSQAELARRMHEPEMNVSSAIRGRHNCKPGFLARAAITFDVSVDFLLGIVAEKKSRRAS